MIAPVDDGISQDYGANPTRGNPHPVFGDYQPDGHTGADYACKARTPVRAVTAGTVLHAARFGGTYLDNPWWIVPGFAGYTYVVDHGSFIGIYGHCLDGGALVTAGQPVSEGQWLGPSGNTGASTGDHLHFEILFKPFLVNSYMYGRSNPATLFSGIQFQSGAITPLEEIDMAAEENIMARLSQIVEWQENQFREVRDNDERNRNMLAGFVRDVVNAKDTITPEQIDARFDALTQAQPASVTLYKGNESPDVYVWDPDTRFRHIGPDEYLALITAGAALTELAQPILDAALDATDV
jgi:hypothetical protein